MEFSEKNPIRKPGIRNKQLTMRKLVNTIGEITRTEGYSALGVNNISRKAEVNKVLIYKYFGSSERLIETYVREKNYWQIASEKLRNPAAEENGDLKEIVTSLLENQLDLLIKDPEMQQLLLWGITSHTELMKEIDLERESVYRDLMKQTGQYPARGEIDVRLLVALLSAGLTFLIIRKEAGEFCGITLNDPADAENMKQVIRKFIALIFEEWDRKKQA